MATLLERIEEIRDETRGGYNTAARIGGVLVDMLGNMSVSVKDYGAVGDGVTDDTAAIQAAINATSTSKVILDIPNGNYRCADSLKYVSNTHIRMANDAWLFPEKVGSHFITTTNTATYYDNVVFDGVKINGEKITAHGSFSSAMLQPYKINGLTIKNCKFINTPVHAIGGMIYIDDFLIENNYFKNIGTTKYKAALPVETGGCIIAANIRNGNITKNRMYDIWQIGVYIGINEAYFTQNIVVSENIINRANDNGIRIDPYGGETWEGDVSYYSNISICNNVIIDVDGSGIRALGKGISITGNTIATRQLVESDEDLTHISHGISIGHGTDITCTGNAIYDKTNVMEAGIKITSSKGRDIKNIVISGNTITGVRKGIWVWAWKEGDKTSNISGINIIGNTISDIKPNVPQAGQAPAASDSHHIYVYGQYSVIKSVQIHSNILNNSDDYGIVIRNSETVDIIGNIIMNCNISEVLSTSGIYIYDSSIVKIADNRIFDTQSTKTMAGAVRMFGNCQEVIVDGNDFRNCKTIAIWVNCTDITGLKIINNNLSGYATPILQTTSIATAVVKNNEGFTTENSGTAQITPAATSVVITHSCQLTPAASNIRIIPLDDMGNAVKWWVTAVGATTFTLNVDDVPGTDINFEWRVVI